MSDDSYFCSSLKEDSSSSSSSDRESEDSMDKGTKRQRIHDDKIPTKICVASVPSSIVTPQTRRKRMVARKSTLTPSTPPQVKSAPRAAQALVTPQVEWTRRREESSANPPVCSSSDPSAVHAERTTKKKDKAKPKETSARLVTPQVKDAHRKESGRSSFSPFVSPAKPPAVKCKKPLVRYGSSPVVGSKRKRRSSSAYAAKDPDEEIPLSALLMDEGTATNDSDEADHAASSEEEYEERQDSLDDDDSDWSSVDAADPLACYDQEGEFDEEEYSYDGDVEYQQRSDVDLDADILAGNTKNEKSRREASPAKEAQPYEDGAEETGHVEEKEEEEETAEEGENDNEVDTEEGEQNNMEADGKHADVGTQQTMDVFEFTESEPEETIKGGDASNPKRRQKRLQVQETRASERGARKAPTQISLAPPENGDGQDNDDEDDDEWQPEGSDDDYESDTYFESAAKSELQGEIGNAKAAVTGARSPRGARPAATAPKRAARPALQPALIKYKNDPLICSRTGRKKKNVPGLGMVYEDEKEMVEEDPTREVHTLKDRLMVAVRVNDLVALGHLIKKKHRFSQEVLAEALHLAVSNGYLGAVMALWLQAQANRHPRDPQRAPNGKQWTRLGISRPDLSPLHAAVKHRHIGILRLFLDEFNLDPNDMDKNKDTALVVACEMNNLRAIELLLEHGADPALGCFRWKDMPAVELKTCNHYNRPSKCDKKGKWQCGALYAAVENNLVGATTLLLRHGVDPDEGMFQQDRYTEKDEHFLPLDMALVKPNYEMIKVLLDHGASRFGVLERANDCAQPLLFRMGHGEKAKSRVIQLLADLAINGNTDEAGASRVAANYIDKCFRFTIHAIQSSCNEPLQRLCLGKCAQLLEAGANPNCISCGHTIPPFEALLNVVRSGVVKESQLMLLDLCLLFFQYAAIPREKFGSLLQVAFEKKQKVFQGLLEEWTCEFPTGRSPAQDTLLLYACRLPEFNGELVAGVMSHQGRVLAAKHRDWALVECLNKVPLDTAFRLAQLNVAKLLRIHIQYGKQVFKESAEQIAERRERQRTRQMTARAQRKRLREERARLVMQQTKERSRKEEERAESGRKDTRHQMKGRPGGASTAPARKPEHKSPKPSTKPQPDRSEKAVRSKSPPKLRPAKDQSASQCSVTRDKRIVPNKAPPAARGKPEQSTKKGSNVQGPKVLVKKAPAGKQPTRESPITRSQRIVLGKAPVEKASRQGQSVVAKRASDVKQSAKENTTTRRQQIAVDNGKMDFPQGHSPSDVAITRAQRQARGISFETADFVKGGPVERGRPKASQIKTKRERSPNMKDAATFHNKHSSNDILTSCIKHPIHTNRTTRSMTRQSGPSKSAILKPPPVATSRQPAAKRRKTVKDCLTMSSTSKRPENEIVAEGLAPPNEQSEHVDKNKKASSWLFNGPERHPVDDNDGYLWGNAKLPTQKEGEKKIPHADKEGKMKDDSDEFSGPPVLCLEDDFTHQYDLRARRSTGDGKLAVIPKDGSNHGGTTANKKQFSAKEMSDDEDGDGADMHKAKSTHEQHYSTRSGKVSLGFKPNSRRARKKDDNKKCSGEADDEKDAIRTSAPRAASPAKGQYEKEVNSSQDEDHSVNSFGIVQI